jgi:2,4-dienoyl-CoA reductase-like NADH-dependent reductase (Old Yellow Enzyme family)
VRADSPCQVSASRPGRSGPEDEGYSKEDEAIQAEGRYPLMLGGRMRSLGVADHPIAEAFADYLTLCRPLIREPGLANRWKSGDDCPSGCFPAFYATSP